MYKFISLNVPLYVELNYIMQDMLVQQSTIHMKTKVTKNSYIPYMHIHCMSMHFQMCAISIATCNNTSYAAAVTGILHCTRCPAACMELYILCIMISGM